MLERKVWIKEFFLFIRENCVDDEVFEDFAREVLPFIEKWKLDLAIQSGPITIMCEGDPYPGYSVTLYDRIKNEDSVTFVFLEEDKKFVEFQIMEEEVRPTLH